MAVTLTLLSRWRPLPYRNQSIDLLCKSMDWFLYDNGLRLERVKKKRFRKKATTKNVASIPVKRVLRKIFHSSCLLGVKKCSFFGKFGMLCFLKTSVLRFALLPCYRCILDASYSPGYAPDYIFLKNMQLHWGTLKWIPNLIKS